MLERVLEPEVMDTAEEARDYDAMDHAAVNVRFCEDLLALGALGKPGGDRDGASPPRVLDVGTGTARIPIELCLLDADVSIEAIDLADHMLTLGQKNVDSAGFSARIRLGRIDAKALPYDDASFDAAVSNSIIHHIPEPAGVFAEMWRVTKSGGWLFVRDLYRPDTEAEIDRLVALYSGTPPSDPIELASFENQRGLFRASLAAALTVADVVQRVAPLGIPASAVRMTSDRHWTLAHRKP